MVDMKLLAFQAIGLACCYFFFKLIMAVPLFRKQMVVQLKEVDLDAVDR